MRLEYFFLKKITFKRIVIIFFFFLIFSRNLPIFNLWQNPREKSAKKIQNKVAKNAILNYIEFCEK